MNADGITSQQGIYCEWRGGRRAADSPSASEPGFKKNKKTQELINIGATQTGKVPTGSVIPSANAVSAAVHTDTAGKRTQCMLN